MLCHECAREGRQQSAVAECRFCRVGLCKSYLVASFTSAMIPQYACDHHPERAFARVIARAERPLAAVS